MIMGAVLTGLFHRQGWRRAPAVMDRTYVSDYTRFMEQWDKVKSGVWNAFGIG
jgi:hypothetical protein